MSKRISVVFVCMGNICRSPLAHAVFSQYVHQHGLSDLIHTDSAGTHAYHTGNKPDIRSIKVAADKGYDLSALRAKKINQSMMLDAHHVLVMDQQNLSDLKLAFASHDNKIELFLNYHPDRVGEDVPDPYYQDQHAFEHVLELVENAALSLLHHLRNLYRL